ncbi:MAG: c-type cytochrome [Ottowia sp.]
MKSPAFFLAAALVVTAALAAETPDASAEAAAAPAAEQAPAPTESPSTEAAAAEAPAAEAEKAAAAAPASPRKIDLAQGEASFMGVCVACHGEGGKGVAEIPTQPRLASQHADYFIKQMMEFRDGKRENAVMAGMAQAVSEDDIHNIAAWLAVQKPEKGQATDKDLVALGEKIYRGGIAARHVPACAGCHSPNGAGIPAQYPRLSGQFVDYTVAQMEQFRDGVRKNSPQMADIAGKMNDREIKAVAEYIAGLN